MDNSSVKLVRIGVGCVCVEFMEAGFHLEYGVWCEFYGHEGANCLSRVRLAWGRW